MIKFFVGLVFTLLFLSVLPANAQETAFIKSTGKNSVYAEVHTANGSWKFSLFPKNIIKASFIPAGSDRNEQVSDAVIAKPLSQNIGINSTAQLATLLLKTGITVTVRDTGLSFRYAGGQAISILESFYSNENRGFTFLLKPGEKIFGTGERSVPLNRRGYKLPLNNAPAYGYSLDAEALNFSVPFILSSEKYALFFDNPSKGFFDIGKTNPAWLEYSVTSGELSFYIIPGKNYEEILEAYQSLVGTAPLPPRWAMGNLMSRFGYRSESQARDIVSLMKRDSVPFDAIIFDLFWFGDSIKNTLGNLSWINKLAWPHPKKMMHDFKNQDIKTILITEPFVLNTSLNYKSSKQLHATDSAGLPYVLQDFYFGKGGIIDIFRKDAQQWFYSKYKAQMDLGVTGWWGDLGEPETHPANVYHNLRDIGFQRRFASSEIHNIYGHYWSRMLAENFKKDFPRRRLFHLNRSGYAGSPRYSSYPWSGDVSRSWDGLKSQLPLIQGMSISGIPYIHSDAGGFAGGDGDAELYVRWLQFAVFTPIYRPHGTAFGNLEAGVKDIPSEAVLWPEPTKTLAKNAAIMRYRWLPYNYNLSYQQTKYGKPLVRPLFFLDNTDSNLYKAADQYLWGDEVMVVPITTKAQNIRSYYIPTGQWTDLYTEKIHTGPAWVMDSSITMESIPVLAKEGSFIPWKEGMQNTAGYNSKALEIIYVPSAHPSKYELYEDDGENANAIRDHQFEITSFSSDGLSTSLSISIVSDGGNYTGRGKERKMELTVLSSGTAPREIKINGRQFPVKAAWNNATKKIKIPFNFQQVETIIRIKY